MEGAPPGWREPRVAIPFGFLAPAACIETDAMRDLDEACGSETYSRDGLLTERVTANRIQRFANGALLEEIEFDAAGRMVRHERTYRGRTDRWAYRADGALIDHRWSTDSRHQEREVLSCDGRIDQLVTNECGGSPRHYEYDEAGRLVRIVDPRGRVEFAHDENRLRAYSALHLVSRYWDAEGRLVRETNGGSAIDGVTHYLYGDNGPTRTYYAGKGGTADHSALTEYRYDEGKFSVWWSVRDSWSGVAGRNHTYTEAHRLTYACAGGKVLEEINDDLDGAADIIISWRRLDDGTIRETRTTAEGEALEWKLYRFRCD